MSVLSLFLVMLGVIICFVAFAHIAPIYVAARRASFVRRTEERKFLITSEAIFSHISWPTAEEKLKEFADEKINLLKDTPNRLYEVRTFNSPQPCPTVKQFTVKINRKAPIPKGIAAYKNTNELVHVEPEVPAQLIFELSPMGDVIVLAYPHSSSCQSLGTSHFILQRFKSATKLLESISSGSLNRVWHDFLIVSEVSAFGSGPIASYAKPRGRLARRSRRFQDLLSSDQEKRMEETKMDVALGVGLAAALFTLATQAFSKIVELPDSAEFFLPLSLAVLFAYFLRRIYRS